MRSTAGSHSSRQPIFGSTTTAVNASPGSPSFHLPKERCLSDSPERSGSKTALIRSFGAKLTRPGLHTRLLGSASRRKSITRSTSTGLRSEKSARAFTLLNYPWYLGSGERT